MLNNMRAYLVKLIYISFLSMGILVGVVNAQTPTQPNTPAIEKPLETDKSSSFEFSDAFKSFSRKIKTKFETLRTHAYTIANSAAVTRLAATLAYALGGIALAIPAFKYALTGSQAELGEILNALMLIGIFTVFMVGGNYQLFTSALIDALANLSNSFSGESQGPLDGMASMIGAMITGQLKNFPGGWDMVTNVGFFVMSIIMLLVALILGLISLIFMVIFLNIGNVLMAVAIALGPIFVALGVWKVTRTFFQKWLNFLLIAAMYQVIAMLMITLISKLAIVEFSTNGLENAANMIYAVMMMAVIAYMSSLIPDIANALMPGNIAGMGGMAGGAKTGAGKGAAALIKPSKSK